MRLFISILFILLQLPGAYVKQLQQRDSILIADQLQYGFQLEDVKAGTPLALPDYSRTFNDTLVLVRGWQLDTLKYSKKNDTYNIDCNIIISPFEEGGYHLPGLSALKGEGDTLWFEGLDIDVKTLPVDTATFVVHDIKGQIRYPLTAGEVIPFLLGLIALGAIAWLLVRMVRRRRALNGEQESKDPAYIVALRKLERFRSEKFWAADKQKAFYSGITDTLREYIADRFGIDACEMTTAEIFAELKKDKDLTPELYSEAKGLFELADLVKFAKMTASDDENAKSLPSAVQFVMATYEKEEKEEDENVSAES